MEKIGRKPSLSLLARRPPSPVSTTLAKRPPPVPKEREGRKIKTLAQGENSFSNEMDYFQARGKLSRSLERSGLSAARTSCRETMLSPTPPEISQRRKISETQILCKANNPKPPVKYVSICKIQWIPKT